MRALILERYGDPSSFVVGEVPTPVVAPGKVLVKVAATSVNQVDIKIRQGLPIGAPLPAVLGADVAGTVASVGAGVVGFAPGDAVYGCAGGVRGHGGALAEYLLADARLLAPKPRTLSMRQAAALPLVGITAWELLERSAVGAGEHILVNGGAGGVGHVTVQLAKTMSARVAATAGADDLALVRSFGADDAVDFRAEPAMDYVERLTAGAGFAVVIDTIGGDNLLNAFTAVAEEGRIATTNARTTQDLGPLHAKAASLHVVFMLLPLLRGTGRERHGRILQHLARLVDDGALRLLVDEHRFSLDTAPDAHRLLESGKAHGKVVIDIAEGDAP